MSRYVVIDCVTGKQLRGRPSLGVIRESYEPVPAYRSIHDIWCLAYSDRRGVPKGARIRVVMAREVKR